MNRSLPRLFTAETMLQPNRCPVLRITGVLPRGE